MSDCIFCKIAAGELPADKVFENDDVVAFRDLNPVAPTHVLVIPKRHVPSLNDADTAGDAAEAARLTGAVLLGARSVAEQEGVAESGYRVVINTMKDAGQVVFHLHAHVLGGRSFSWPPG